MAKTSSQNSSNAARSWGSSGLTGRAEREQALHWSPHHSFQPRRPENLEQRRWCDSRPCAGSQQTIAAFVPEILQFSVRFLAAAVLHTAYTALLTREIYDWWLKMHADLYTGVA